MREKQPYGWECVTGLGASRFERVVTRSPYEKNSAIDKYKVKHLRRGSKMV